MPFCDLRLAVELGDLPEIDAERRFRRHWFQEVAALCSRRSVCGWERDKSECLVLGEDLLFGGAGGGGGWGSEGWGGGRGWGRGGR
jgi:hypothetical protein